MNLNALHPYGMVFQHALPTSVSPPPLTSPRPSESSPSKLISRPPVSGCLGSTPIVVIGFRVTSGVSILSVAVLPSPT